MGMVDTSRRLAERGVRLAQLVAARAGSSAADALRRKANELEIRIDGLHKGLEVKPITDIPFPALDLAICDDPIVAITAAPEFAMATAFFADNPVAARSLIPPQAQAILYCLIRNQRPDHVFEIGSYKAGTTEALARALHANGKGVAHTVDPFRGDYVAAVLKSWPPQLFRHVRLHSMDSMAFYKNMERQGIHPGIVFVDGNHDYEFAAFDIACGARATTPDGYVFVDNVAQPGPFFAACDFLTTNPDWRELGGAAANYDRGKAFDRYRRTILHTDFMVLRAPTAHCVSERPFSSGRVRWGIGKVTGVRLKLVPPTQPGRLSVQVVLRGFGAVPGETTGGACVQVETGTSELAVTLTEPAQLDGRFAYFTAEPWLIWHGAPPLKLNAEPQLY